MQSEEPSHIEDKTEPLKNEHEMFDSISNDIEVIIADIKTLPPSREQALVVTKLQEANLWLSQLKLKLFE